MRLYNGCPDSELQAIIDRRCKLRAELSAKFQAHVTHFYGEDGGYQVWRDLKPISKTWPTFEEAAEEVLRREDPDT